MTDRMEKFCREYMVDLDSTHAAIRAGYSKGTANKAGPRLKKHPLVAARIAELQKEAADRNDVEVDEVIQKLRDSYRDAKAAKQHGPAVRAVELLGKHIGMFTDKLTLTEDQRMSDEELIEKMAGGGLVKLEMLRKTLLVPDDFEDAGDG